MKKIKKFFKEVINFIFILFLLPSSLIIFFWNYNKIYKSDLVIYLKNGGFGHDFTAQDLLRYTWKDKKIIYLQFYDSSRLNIYLNKIFNHETIVLPTVIYFNFLKIKFGEYEGSFFNIIEKTILIFLKNKLSINEFYLYLEKKYKNVRIKKRNSYRWVDIYFYLIEKKRKKLNFFSNRLHLQNKICTIYLRQKYSKQDFSNSIRSGSLNAKVYFDMINYLIKKDYIIYLVGDDFFTTKEIEIFKGKVMNYRSLNLEKKYFNIYAAVNCDLFISEAGGGHWFGLYAKKSILINCLPYGYRPFNFKKILYKKVIDRNNTIIPYKKANNNFYLSYKKIQNYKVINNSSKELLTLIRSIV
jgi:putative glycosyltransferase (TIGR04372 family)